MTPARNGSRPCSTLREYRWLTCCRGTPTPGTSTASRAAELEDGAEALHRLLGLLPRLRVVVLLGGSARDAWRRLVRRHPGLVSALEVVPTCHTGNQALIGSAQVRSERLAALHEAFEADGPDPPGA